MFIYITYINIYDIYIYMFSDIYIYITLTLLLHGRKNKTALEFLDKTKKFFR